MRVSRFANGSGGSESRRAIGAIAFLVGGGDPHSIRLDVEKRLL
jgi:hypothetical protein